MSAPLSPTPFRSPGRLRLAASFGLAGVALGAFGAHALRPALEARGTVGIWGAAVLYHLVHAVVLLFVAREPVSRWIPAAFAGGIVLFSGSLYVLALVHAPWLGPVTPLGGLGFLAGWIGLIVQAGRAAR